MKTTTERPKRPPFVVHRFVPKPAAVVEDPYLVAVLNQIRVLQRTQPTQYALLLTWVSCYCEHRGIPIPNGGA